MADEIRERLAATRERIRFAAERAGRKAEEITLIAVSKTIGLGPVQQAVDSGIRNLGENRVQEAAEKAPLVKGSGLHWHLIGHLQSNKARRAVATFDTIHTVDSIELAEHLDRLAGETGRRPRVLVQVKLGDELTKSGLLREKLGGVIEALDKARYLELRGLMGIPPMSDVAEDARLYFKQLRLTLEEINRSRPRDRALTELSMGMTHDFEIAVEEGATMVRIGTAIFGARS
jgi:pyridoxal phosphate enzyme (YggS family)